MTRYFPEDSSGSGALQEAVYDTDAPIVLAGRTSTRDDGSGVLVWDIAAVGNSESAERWHLIPAGQRTGIVVASNLNATGDYAIDPDTGEVLDFNAALDHWIVTTREDGRNLTVIRAMSAEDVTAPTVGSATVSIDDPDALVVVFSEEMHIDAVTGLTAPLSVGTTRTITGVTSGTGTDTITFALSGAFAGTEVGSFVVGAGRVAQDLNGQLLTTGSTPLTLDFAPPTPLEILGADLALWLCGDVGRTSGTWTDQGPDHNDFTGEHSPGAGTMGPHALACATFDGINQDYVTGAWPTSWTAAEGFIVFQSAHDPPDATPSTDIGGLWYFGAGTQVVVPYTTSLVHETFGSTVNKAAITGWTTNSDDQVTLYNARSAAGAFSLYQNGVQFFTTATNTVGMGVSAWIGSGGSAPYMFSGKVGEVIVAKRILTGPERTAIQAHLNARWGTAT